VLLLVFWVWANVEATANPKIAMMARSKNNVFISVQRFGLNLVRADKEESLRTFAADVETDRVTAKVTCFYKLCRSLRSGQDNPFGDS
jgi:hypothetical protein